MYRIVTNTFERKLYYKNTVVLKYKIEYPQILGNSFGIHRFNRFNFIKAIKLKQYSEKNLFKEAKELYYYWWGSWNYYSYVSKLEYSNWQSNKFK